MTLITACILSPSKPQEGYRASVMSRHTLNDGVTPDTRLTEYGVFHYHLPILGFPEGVGMFHRGEINWEEYARRYKEHLRQPHVDTVLKVLSRRAMRGNVTLLCIEKTPERCHRRFIAERCKEIFPDLAIIVG